MRILKKLGNEEITTTDKLEAIKNMVTDVRAEYGNLIEDIDPIKVATADGYVPLSLLTDAEKVAVAHSQIKVAVANATIVTEATQGSKFDRVFEAQIAVDAILCNLDAKSDSEY